MSTPRLSGMAAAEFLCRLPRVPEGQYRYDNCMICLCRYGTGRSRADDSEVAVRLPCDHIVGLACISTWLQQENGTKNNTCPCCRFKFFDVPSPRSASSIATRSEALRNLYSFVPPTARGGQAQSHFSGHRFDEDPLETDGSGHRLSRPFQPFLEATRQQEEDTQAGRTLGQLSEHYETPLDPVRLSQEIGRRTAESTREVLERSLAASPSRDERYRALLEHHRAAYQHLTQQFDSIDRSGMVPQQDYTLPGEQHTSTTVRSPAPRNGTHSLETAPPSFPPPPLEQHPAFRHHVSAAVSPRRRNTVYGPGAQSWARYNQPETYDLHPPVTARASPLHRSDSIDDVYRDLMQPAAHRTPMLPEEHREMHRQYSDTLNRISNQVWERSLLPESRVAQVIQAAARGTPRDPIVGPPFSSNRCPNRPHENAPPLPPRPSTGSDTGTVPPRTATGPSLGYSERHDPASRRQYPAPSSPRGFPYQHMPEGPPPVRIPVVHPSSNSMNRPTLGGPVRREEVRNSHQLLRWLNARDEDFRPNEQEDQGAPTSYPAPGP